MDVHPSRELVASGQRAGADRKSQAHVRIWSTESLQTLYVFGMGELNVGITAVAFSQLVSFRIFGWNCDCIINSFSSQNGGSYILAADASPDSVLAVYQWQWGHLLGKVAVSHQNSFLTIITESIYSNLLNFPDSPRKPIRFSIPSAGRQPNHNAW